MFLNFRVSSVLNKDSKTYGKQYLFDGSEETCWNSDAGDLQWVIVKFEGIVSFSQVSIATVSVIFILYSMNVFIAHNLQYIIIQKLFLMDNFKMF